jgi:hypothetical protein
VTQFRRLSSYKSKFMLNFEYWHLRAEKRTED